MRATTLACAALLALTVGAREARAFHAVDSFSDAASVGGGSGTYYTGSPRFRGGTAPRATSTRRKSSC